MLDTLLPDAHAIDPHLRGVPVVAEHQPLLKRLERALALVQVNRRARRIGVNHQSIEQAFAAKVAAETLDAERPGAADGPQPKALGKVQGPEALFGGGGTRAGAIVAPKTNDRPIKDCNSLSLIRYVYTIDQYGI